MFQCIHHHNQNIKHFYHSKQFPPDPLPSVATLYLQFQETTDFFLCFVFPRHSYKWNRTECSFMSCFFHCKVFLKFIHIVVYFNSLLLHIADYYSIVWVHNCLSSPVFMDIWDFPVRNKATVTAHLQVFV